jgi:hypothetical protein
LLIVLAACKQVPVRAMPMEIVRHRAEFQQRGFARVDVVEGGTIAVDSERELAMTIPGNQKSYAWGLVKKGQPTYTTVIKVGDLLAECDEQGRGAKCLASRVVGPSEIGIRRKVDPKLVAIGLFGVATMIASGACLAICKDNGEAAYIGFGISVAVMIWPLSTVF